MRLSSLELQGFKSFPDKTRLEFDHGITAVVGPNGSGKSNIADAVRWVLGEQSTKTLRGDRMEDVIFSGTQQRNPVGYAAVDLTIDNSSGAFSEYDDELTIGRRLYRSGESEYRINGEMVRMRDVHELFMDTGLGRDGYSIIGQGKIADIVSAKSSQRREIFEEAAGIAKYRYRRTDAERQLDRAQENLVRLYDILAELEGRVEPLRIQSEKAKKYLKLADERKDLEISIWVHSLEELKGKLAQQENKLLTARGDYRRLERQGEDKEQEIANTYDTMQRLVVQADECRRLVGELEEELSAMDAQVAVHRNDREHNQQRLEILTQEQQGAGEGERETRKRLEEKEALSQRHKEQLAQTSETLEKTRQQLVEAQRQGWQLKESQSGLEARKSSLEQAISQLKIKQSASDTLLSESQSQLEELKNKDGQHSHYVEECAANADDCDKQVAQQRQHILALKNTLEGYRLKGESKRESHQNLEKEKANYLRQMEEKMSRRKLLQDMESNMEGYAGSVRYILRQSKQGTLSGVFGPVSSLITADAKHIAAIETALGGAMQNLVVQDEGVAKRGISMLRDARVGRATFLPLTSVKGRKYNFSQQENHPGFIGAASDLVTYDPEFEGVIQQLLGRICVVDDLDTGSAIARQAGYRFRVVTLDGQVINAGGSYTGGTTSRSAGVLGRRNEISQLQKQAKAFHRKAQDLEPTLKKSSAELARIEAMFSGASAEIQTAEEELVRLGFSKQQLDKELDNARNSRQLAEQELDKLLQRLRSLEQGQSTSQQLMKENNEQLEEISSQLIDISEKVKENASTQENLRQQLSDTQMQELSEKNTLENMLDEVQRLNEQLENADLQSQRLREEIQSLGTRNEEIEKRLAESRERREKLVAQVDTHNATATEAMAKRTQLEKNTTDLRQQERALSSQREDVSRELARLEERQMTMQQEYDGLIAKLWDEYELTRSQAVETAQTLQDVAASRQRLRELRGKIRRLGTVNVDAVEEYKEVSQRYEFLSQQVKDAEQSREKLMELIHELTEDMQVLFVDSFEQIAHEFSKTFVELFGGGHGELRLTDHEDVLEAGIDIHVQPPGKVIKNLSLLSGGEQSFVAIAIYFSILKVRPAPFVLLDEIEAALDDINVIKFAQYLRLLSDKTQFIAITHRRGTMEEADILYGVTMQENGVSKLLELNVHEVESRLGMGADE